MKWLAHFYCQDDKESYHGNLMFPSLQCFYIIVRICFETQHLRLNVVKFTTDVMIQCICHMVPCSLTQSTAFYNFLQICKAQRVAVYCVTAIPFCCGTAVSLEMDVCIVLRDNSLPFKRVWCYSGYNRGRPWETFKVHTLICVGAQIPSRPGLGQAHHNGSFKYGAGVEGWLCRGAPLRHFHQQPRWQPLMGHKILCCDGCRSFPIASRGILVCARR